MVESSYSRALFRAAAGSLAVGLLLTLSATQAQEPAPEPVQKYRFRNIAAAGDSRSIDDLMDMSLDLVITLEGQEVPSKFAMRSRQTYTEQILAAVKGDATVIRRKYTVHREAETTPDGMTKVKVSSLQGKTVTLRISGRKVTVTADKGKLAPADVKKLQEKLADNDDGDGFLPDRDLAPGEEWTLAPDLVRKMFKGMEKGEVKGRFERVFNEAGRSLAEFRLDLSLEGAAGGSPIPITMKGTGAAFFDLKLKRELGTRFGGPISLEGDVEQEGRKLRIVGSGLMDARQSVRWLKVAGKPVNAPAYPPPGAPAPDPNRQAGL